MKDDIKAAWGEIKEYIEMQLNCVMHIMASGHLRQNNDVEKDGITTYLDVTNVDIFDPKTRNSITELTLLYNKRI